MMHESPLGTILACLVVLAPVALPRAVMGRLQAERLLDLVLPRRERTPPAPGEGGSATRSVS